MKHTETRNKKCSNWNKHEIRIELMSMTNSETLYSFLLYVILCIYTIYRKAKCLVIHVECQLCMSQVLLGTHSD